MSSDSTPPSEPATRISDCANLCRVCPHQTCPGVRGPLDEAACRTIKSLFDGEITFDHAVEAKAMQRARHDRTDAFRDYAFERVLEDQPRVKYSVKKTTGRFVSYVTKGHSPYQLRKSRAFTSLTIDDECCVDLIKARFELDPERTSLY